MQSYLEAGKLVTTHGVTGELKFEIWCDGVDFLKKFKVLYAKPDGTRPMRVVSVRSVGRMGLLRLEGVDTMDAARALVGTELYFAREDAKLPKGVWFRSDLVGCEVRDAATGGVYGVVSKIDHPGAQDIYTVKARSGKEYMFPGVPEFLKEKNPVEGYIVVAPIEGMFDEGAIIDRPTQGAQAEDA